MNKFTFKGLLLILCILFLNVFGGFAAPNERATHIRSALSEEKAFHLENRKGGVLNIDSGKVKLDIPAHAVRKDSIPGAARRNERAENRINENVENRGNGHGLSFDTMAFDSEQSAMAVESTTDGVDSVEITAQKIELNYDIKKFSVCGDIYEFGPHGLEFDEPVELTLPYVSAEGRSEKFINIYYYNPETMDWDIMPKVDQDFENNTITVEITHFSTYSPGVGSYVVSEGVSPNSNYVSNQGESVDARSRVLHMGGTDFSRKEIGVNLAIGRKFSSDDFWGLIDHEVKKTAINDKSSYSFAAGWRWTLPEFDLNATAGNIYAQGSSFITESGTVYDLGTIMKANLGSESAWIEGYRSYNENGKYFIEILSEQIILECTRTVYSTHAQISDIIAYYPDGRVVTFDFAGKTGVVKTISDGNAANTLTYAFDSALRLSSITYGTTGHVLNFVYTNTDITVNFDTSQVVKYLISDISTTDNSQTGIPFLSGIEYGTHVVTPVANRKSKTTSFACDTGARTFTITYHSGKTSTYSFIKEEAWRETITKRTETDYTHTHLTTSTSTGSTEETVYWQRKVSRHVTDGGAGLAAGKTITEYSISEPDRITSTYSSSRYTGYSTGSSESLLCDSGCSSGTTHDSNYVDRKFDDITGDYNYPGIATVTQKYMLGGVETEYRKITSTYEYETGDSSKGYVTESENSDAGTLYFVGVKRQETSVKEEGVWIVKDVVEHSYGRIAPHYYKVTSSSYYKGGSATAQFTTSTLYDDYGQAIKSVGPEGETTYTDYVKTWFDKNTDVVELNDDGLNEMFDYSTSTATYSQSVTETFFIFPFLFSGTRIDATFGPDYPVPGYMTVTGEMHQYFEAKAVHEVTMSEGFTASASTGGFEAKVVPMEKMFVQQYWFANNPYRNRDGLHGVRAFGLVSGTKRVIDSQLTEESFFAYDTNRNLIESRSLKMSAGGSPEWAQHNFYYNTRDQLTGFADPLGNTVSIGYGTGDYEAFITGDSQTILFDADRSFENKRQVTNYSYDILGRMTMKDSYYCDEYDQKLTGQDSAVLYYQYDNLNRVIATFADAKLVSRYFYNDRTAANQNPYDILMTVDAEGQITLAQYDALDRVVSTEKYEPWYQHVGVRDRYFDNLVMDYTTVNVGQMLNSIGDVAVKVASTAYTYDDKFIGKPKSVTSGGVIDGIFTTSTTTSFYDALGRSIKTQVDGRNVNQTRYNDAVNSVESFVVQDHVNGVDWYSWSSVKKDWSGRVIETQTSPNRDYIRGTEQSAASFYPTLTTIVKNVMSYNNAGNLISRTMAHDTPDAQTFTYSYNSMGQLLQTTYPDGKTEKMSYDLSGRLTTFTDKKGNTVNTAYDSLGRVRTTTYVGGSAGDDYSVYTDYGHLGLPVYIKTELEGIQISENTYAFDRFGGLTTETVDYDAAVTGPDYTITRSYDDLGAVSQMTFSGDGVSKSFKYNGIYNNDAGDQGGLSSQLKVLSGGVYTDLATFAHTGFGGIGKLHYAGKQISYTDRDNFLRPQRISYDGVIADLNLAYEYTGNVKSYDGRGFTYDSFGRMLSETNTGAGINYTYDLLHNRTDKVTQQVQHLKYNYDDPFKMLLTSIDNDANTRLMDFTYDAAGNMETKSDTQTGDNWAYTYDSRNQLVSVTKNGLVAGSYTYNHAGHRIKKVEDGKITYYVYEGNSVLYEKTVDETTSALLNREINVIFEGQNIAKYSGATLDTLEYHLLDHLGSRKAVLDSAGNIVEQIGFSVWGELESGSSENFNYTGKSLDNSTGLLYFNARYYDPSIGRFITQDPIKDGLNWYVYCSNNPLKYTDPNGLEIKVAEGLDLKTILYDLQRIAGDGIFLFPDKNRFIRYVNLPGEGNKPKGEELIKRLVHAKKLVKITPYTEENRSPAAAPVNESSANMENAANGKGIHSYLYYEPIPGSGISTINRNSNGVLLRESMTPKIILAHELIHSLHFAEGTISTGYSVQSYIDPDTGEYVENVYANEEFATVGIPGVPASDITENDIREENGENPREYY